MKMTRSATSLREADLVGDDDHGHAGLGEAPDHREHLGDELRVEGGGGLVEEHEARRDRERPRDRDALLLPSGEPVRQVIAVLPEADAGQQLHRRRLGVPRGLAVDPHRRLADVLEGGEVMEEG